MKKLIFIALIFMFLLSSAFSYTAPTFEGQPIIVESSSDFYGSSTGRVTIDLNLTSINTTFKDFFIRIRGLDDTNVIVKEISFNKTKIGTLSYPVQQVSKTKINQKLMDKAPLQIVLEFDPLELGVGKEFDIQLVDKDNLIIADLDPFLSGWDYRQEWTLNTNGISLSGDVTADHVITFVKTSSDSDFWTNVDPDGDDVRFTDSSNNLYDYYFQYWNSSTDDMIARVEITETFDSTTDNTGYIYYGNSGASAVASTTNTFPSDYLDFYHLDETSGTTATDQVGTQDGNTNNTAIFTTSIAGALRTGADFSNSVNDAIEITGVSSTGTTNTISMWFKDSSISDERFFDSETGRIILGTNSSGYFEYYNGGWKVSDTIISDGSWHYLNAVADSTTLRLYVDGVEVYNDTFGGVDIGGRTLIGGTPPIPLYLPCNSYVDEVSILNKALSYDEVKLLFASESKNLVSYSAQEIAETNTAPDLNITNPTLSAYWKGSNSITFNVMDIDLNTTLDVNLFYSSSAGSQTNLIIHDANLSDGSGITCSDYNFQDSTGCSYSWDTTTASDGNYYIDANVFDGTISYSTSSNWFLVDNTNPTATSITITDVGGRTEDKAPDLTLSATDGAGSGLKQMAFSCNNSTWGSWIAYNTSYSAFDLTTGAGCSATYGAKTIYFKVRDNADNESSSVNDSTILDAVVTYGDLNIFRVGDLTQNADFNINSDVNLIWQFKVTSDDLNTQSAKVYYQSPFNDSNCSGYIRGTAVCGFQTDYYGFFVQSLVSTTFTMRSLSEDDHAYKPYAYNSDPDDFHAKSGTSILLNNSGTNWGKTLLSNVLVDSNVFYNLSFFANFTGATSRTLNVYDCNSNVANPVGNANCFVTPFTAGSLKDADSYYSIKHISDDLNQIDGVQLNADGNHFVYFNCPTCNVSQYWNVGQIDVNSNVDKTRNWLSTSGLGGLTANVRTIDAHYHFLDLERNNIFTHYFTIDNNQGKTYTSNQVNDEINLVNIAPMINEFVSPVSDAYSGNIDINISVSDPENNTLVCDFNLVNSSFVHVGVLAEDLSPIGSICSFDFNSLLYSDGNYYVKARVRETDTAELFSQISYSGEFEIDNVLPQAPTITIVYPNGNESFTSDVDTPTIIFTLKDTDSTPLYVNLNYSATTEIGSGTAILFEENVITSGVVVCDDSDFTNDTNCSYTWDMSGVADGNYYLNMVVSDGVLDANDVSDGDFIVASTPPVISPVVYDERYINPNYEQRDENIYFSASQGYSLTDEEKQNIYLQQVTLILVIIGIIIGIGVFILWKRKK